MVQNRKPNCEKVISKILSLIFDERVFKQSRVLLDSKLNIPSRGKWCRQETQLYKVLSLEKNVLIDFIWQREETYAS